jgi:hypothetical protein
MLNTKQKEQLFLIFGCIKKEISKKNWGYESKPHRVDSMTENPFLTLKSGEQVVDKVMKFLNDDSKFRNYINVSHEKNLIYIHWLETTDALLYLDTYNAIPSSSTENETKPTPPDSVPLRADEPTDILSTFKALVKKCGGLSGVHFDRIELQLNRKDSKFPVITLRNNGESQSERTQLFLIELGLEPLILNNKAPNVVSFNLPDTVECFNVEDIAKLKESFPDRKVLESEQTTRETPPIPPVPATPPEPKHTPQTGQSNSALIEAVGVTFDLLSNEDKVVFGYKFLLPSILETIRKDERKRIKDIINNFLSKEYGIVKINDAVAIEKDPITGNIGFTIKSIDPSTLLG